MTLAIMQPYFFPYIGYFQLINAADVFILYDDVNYIKQGWINRNRILLNNKDHYFTLNLTGASSFKSINEIDIGNNREKLIKTIQQAYSNAPYFHKVYPIIENILKYDEKNLSSFIDNSVRQLCSYFNIITKIVVSSDIKKNNTLKGQDKIISICKDLNADTYINAIGGQVLYSKEVFNKNRVELKFIKSGDIKYKQFNNDFIPNLSIIDLIMFNSPSEIEEKLNQYTLI